MSSEAPMICDKSRLHSSVNGGAATVIPCRRNTFIIFSRSGGPPPAALITSAASRKYAGPMIAGHMTASCFTSSLPKLSKRCTAPRGDTQCLPRTNLDRRAINRPGQDALDTVDNLLIGIVLVGRGRQLLPRWHANLEHGCAAVRIFARKEEPDP